jgi:hypothetical protein
MNFYKFCEAKVAPSGLTSLHDWYIITLQKLVHFSIAINTPPLCIDLYISLVSTFFNLPHIERMGDQ